jgi:hypothetical protein
VAACGAEPRYPTGLVPGHARWHVRRAIAWRFPRRQVNLGNALPHSLRLWQQDSQGSPLYLLAASSAQVKV